MPQLWKQAPEEWEMSSLFGTLLNSVISGVKLSVKFYSLQTTFRAVIRVDARVYVGIQTNKQTKTCTPKLPC